MADEHDDTPKILGFNTRWLPSRDPLLNRSVGYCVVLVAGAVEDYAAYAGLVQGHNGWAPQEEMQYLARYGDKIAFEEACCHFPKQLTRKHYRD